MEKCPMPTKGLIVFYTHRVDSDPSEIPNISPGIVTKVYENGNIDFHGFTGNGSFVRQNITYSPMKDRGHWHWRND